MDLSQLFSDRDFEIGYDEESAVHMPLGSPSTCDSDAVTVESGDVVRACAIDGEKFCSPVAEKVDEE